MADPSTAAPLIAALEGLGVKLIDADKQRIEAYVEPLADSDANAIINAIAEHISLNGMASVVQTPLRNALIGAEPNVDSVINANIDGGFDQLEALLTNLAKQSAAP